MKAITSVFTNRDEADVVNNLESEELFMTYLAYESARFNSAKSTVHRLYE